MTNLKGPAQNKMLLQSIEIVIRQSCFSCPGVSLHTSLSVKLKGGPYYHLAFEFELKLEIQTSMPAH